MKVFEKNGYIVSELTLGTVQLGIPYGINNTHGMPTYEESKAILKAATDGGIISFDTAKNYGKSEEVLGRFFAESKAPKTLITKVELDGEKQDEVKEKLFEKVKDSIKVLGVKKLPLVMLHKEDYLETYGKTLVDALKELKNEGLVSSLGISFQDKNKIERLLDFDLFDSIQVPANMLDNKEIKDGTFKKLAQNNVAVYIRSVYLQGLFFRNPELFPEKLSSAKPVIAKLNAIAEENNMNMAGLAVSYMRSAGGVASLVLGCETVPQLEESISLFELPVLDKSVIDRINELSEEIDPVVIRPWEWNK